MWNNSRIHTRHNYNRDGTEERWKHWHRLVQLVLWPQPLLRSRRLKWSSLHTFTHTLIMRWDSGSVVIKLYLMWTQYLDHIDTLKFIISVENVMYADFNHTCKEFNGVCSTLACVFVMNTDGVFMRRFVNVAVKKTSDLWAAEETEFMLAMLRNINIMQFIDGQKHQNEDTFRLVNYKYSHRNWLKQCPVTHLLYEFIICAVHMAIMAIKTTTYHRE